LIEAELEIVNRLGLHARAAAKFVQTAASFSATISIRHGDRAADAKSIMSVMMLAASKGSTLAVRADGEDEIEALSALQQLVAARFDEAE